MKATMVKIILIFGMLMFLVGCVNPNEAPAEDDDHGEEHDDGIAHVEGDEHDEPEEEIHVEGDEHEEHEE